jgi:hypothetical protein
VRVTFAAALVVAAVGFSYVSAQADSWSRYENARFGYGIDIPPGFSEVAEAQNGDGGVSASADGTAELRIWGGYLVVGDFKSDIDDSVRSDQAEGWAISYDRRKADSASWSGSRGDRIIYVRAVKACDDSAVHFRLEYDRGDLDAFDAIVSRLVRSLRAC